MSAVAVDAARPESTSAPTDPPAASGSSRRRGAFKVLLVVGFYALATLFFFRPVVLHDQNLSTVAQLEQYYYPWQVDHQYGLPYTIQTDEGQTFYPRQVFVDRLVHDGQLPSWDPYTFAGHPYLSNGATTFFYPVRQAVTWLADPALAHDIYLMLHMFGAGLAMYFLCRELRTSTPSALLAGVAWMWSPYFLGWINLELSLPIIAWLPVALALVHRAHHRRTWAPLAGAAAVIGLMLNGGTLDQATGAVALVGAYGGCLELADLWRTRRLASLRRRAAAAFGRLAALGALGVGIGMVTYLPFALLSRRIARAPIPYDVFVRELNVPLVQFAKIFTPLPAPPGVPELHHMTFAGTAIAVLAIVGVFTRRPGAGLGRALLVGSVAVFAHTPLVAVIDKLSSQYRYISPGRFLWAWVLGLVVLAALGLDVVLARIVGVRAEPGLEPIPHADLRWQRPTGRHVAAAVLAVVVLAGTGVQLYRYGRDLNPRFTPREAEYLFPTTPVIDRIMQRGATPAGDRNLPVYVEKQGEPIGASLPLIFPFESVAGYDSALPSWVAGLWRVVTGDDPTFVSEHPLSQGLLVRFSSTATRFDLLPRLGVTSVLTAPTIDQTPGWDPAGVAAKGLTLDYDGHDGKLYSLPSAAPRAYVVHATETERSEADGLARFTDSAFPWQTTVLLAGDSGASGPSTPLEPATVTAHGLDSASVRVHSTGPGWLVLLDSYDEGWTATVNGRSTPVRRANTSFRAVAVPDGDSIVEFHYATPGLKLGAGISVVALAVVAVLAVAEPVRRRRRPRPEPAGAQPSPA